MNIPYNVTGKERRRLADEIGNALGTVPRYLGVPTYKYAINDCELDKGGTLTIPNTMQTSEIDSLIEHLKGCGFNAESIGTEDKLVISVPIDGFTDIAKANLIKLIENNKTIFQHAFQTENVSVEISDDKLSFPWFAYTDEQDRVQAYTQFVSKLYDMEKVQKRVSSKVNKTDNEKYTFRCFLLRLGFIGVEYKKARKILLENLTGNSTFRNVE